MRMNPQDATTRNARKFYVNAWVKLSMRGGIVYIGKVREPIPANPTNPTSYFQVQLLFRLEVADVPRPPGAYRRRHLTRLSSQEVEMYKTQIENARHAQHRRLSTPGWRIEKGKSACCAKTES